MGLTSEERVTTVRLRDGGGVMAIAHYSFRMPSIPPLYPLRFVPIFKSALWGGRRIADYFPNAPKEGPISEVWLVSDVANNASVVADGPLAGTTLRDLMHGRRAELGLPHHETFPLLIKIIDAREPLSVQVHPNDEQAQRLAGQPRGKTEAWYVLHAEPGAKIYAGFKPGMDRQKFLEAFHAGRIEETLHSFEAKAGDCVYLPAGTIHAAGSGLAIFEVQQTSDITYRLHDWGRVDAKTGKPRELHVENAIECLDFGIGAVNPVEQMPPSMDLVENSSESTGAAQATGDLVPHCRYFGLHRNTARVPNTFELAAYRLVFAVSGEAILEDIKTNHLVPFEPGTVLLVPPGEYVLRPKSKFEYFAASSRESGRHVH